MENGTIKSLALCLMLLICNVSFADKYVIQATTAEPVHDVSDFSQSDTRVVDLNGIKCALLKVESAIPDMLEFDLGSQQIEKREVHEDEVWLWMSADVRKITIKCESCTPLKGYRVKMEPGHVYHVKIITGHPKETSTKQQYSLYCAETPFYVSIDGRAADTCQSDTYRKEIEVGRHEVVVSSRLYKTNRHTIRLNRSYAYNDTVVLDPNYGELNVTISEPGCKLYVDDQLQNNFYNIKLKEGEHHVVVKKPDFLPFEASMQIQVGEKRFIQPKLLPAILNLSIRAKEEDTEIWVDNVLRGKGQITLQVQCGMHIIHARRENCAVWEYKEHLFTEESNTNILIPELTRTGITTIITDENIAIFTQGKDEDITFRGINQWTGKMPVGQNTIYLRDVYETECKYPVFIKENQTEGLVKCPFVRKVKIRTTQTGTKIELKDSTGQTVSLKRAKTKQVNPVVWQLNVSKRKYQTYTDTLDLSSPTTQNVLRRIRLYREGDTTSHKRINDSRWPSKFYTHSGTSFIGVLEVGYHYSFIDTAHYISAAILPFRCYLFELSLIHVECNVHAKDFAKKIFYKPTIGFCLPVSKEVAFGLYSGGAIDLSPILNQLDDGMWPNSTPNWDLVCGFKLHVSGVPVMPMDIFTEYRMPVNNKAKELRKSGFNVGISFALGVDK